MNGKTDERKNRWIDGRLAVSLGGLYEQMTGDFQMTQDDKRHN